MGQSVAAINVPKRIPDVLALPAQSLAVMCDALLCAFELGLRARGRIPFGRRRRGRLHDARRTANAVEGEEEIVFTKPEVFLVRAVENELLAITRGGDGARHEGAAYTREEKKKKEEKLMNTCAMGEKTLAITAVICNIDATPIISTLTL